MYCGYLLKKIYDVRNSNGNSKELIKFANDNPSYIYMPDKDNASRYKNAVLVSLVLIWLEYVSMKYIDMKIIQYDAISCI